MSRFCKSAKIFTKSFKDLPIRSKLDRERQREALRELRGLGASVRQLQRLTGLGRGLIQRI